MQKCLQYRLCSITRRRNPHLPSKQYETCDTGQRIVSIWTQGLQQSRWPHVHGRNGGHPHQQWRGTQYFANKQSSDVIGCRGRTGCIVHQSQNNSVDALHTQGNGTSANLHPHPNQQFNCSRTTHQKNLPKALKVMDMQFHWLHCRKVQDQYQFYRRPGTQNLADYWTKHHPASHHESFGHKF